MGTARQRLWEVALDQHGFVTTDDARAVEVTPDAIKLLARRGTLHREAHGVYRFVNFPASRADDYQQAVLWTGQPLAALSHETALELLELGDVNPDRIHVTVPPGARVRAGAASGSLSTRSSCLLATSAGGRASAASRRRWRFAR